MRDKVTLYVTLLIGVFIIISMVGNFVLLVTGVLDPEDSDVWRPLFDLVAILVGSVAGYIGGVEVEKNRKRKGDDGESRNP